jgi:arabinan endo-1,5-alpha-L-arabinosidase
MASRTALVAAVLSSFLLDAGPAQARPAVEEPPRPVFAQHFGDPSVVLGPRRFVATATGGGAPRASAPSPSGPWTRAVPALAALPAWATGRALWASDLHKVAGRWLLYYAAPVAGLGVDDRCIGVARADAALGSFVPVGRRPLVCPRRADAPKGWDHVPRFGQGLPLSGVIDPSVLVDDDQLYLAYKTQGLPSTIRLVQLNGRGTRTARDEPGKRVRSREVLRSPGTVENPVLVRRGRHVVLFTSEGDYGRCRYRTTWRRSEDLWDFSASRKHVLLKQAQAGICGPGGADVVQPGGRTLLFFHGWMCRALGPDARCPRGFQLEYDAALKPRRSMFAARIVWSARDRPKILKYFAPTSTSRGRGRP